MRSKGKLPGLILVTCVLRACAGGLGMSMRMASSNCSSHSRATTRWKSSRRYVTGKFVAGFFALRPRG